MMCDTIFDIRHSKSEESNVPSRKPQKTRKTAKSVKKSKQQKNILTKIKFSSRPALIVALVFAVIGGYFTWRSFAMSDGPTFKYAENKGTVAGEILMRFKAGVPEDKQSELLNRYQSRLLNDMPQIGIKHISVPEQATGAVIEALSHNPLVEFAEPNGYVTPTFIPNDPRWGVQEGSRLTGTADAWDVTLGDSKTIIAVADVGFHTSLSDNIDGLTQGYDVYSNDSNVAPDVDNFSHGDSVIGVAGARTNNSVGIAGYCGRCTIMPLKIAGSDASAPWSVVATAINYAADRGAKVFNLSFAGSTGSSTMASAITYGYNKGMLTVASAGNSGSTSLAYPAAYPNVISVAATSYTDSIEDYSNRGTWVKVAAPGMNYTTKADGTFGYFSGTSSAAPAVAGILGVAISAHPGATVSQIENALYSSAKPIGSGVKYGRVQAAGLLQALGSTVARDDILPSVYVKSPPAGSTISGIATISVEATDNVGVKSVALNYTSNTGLAGGWPAITAAPYNFSWNTTSLADGQYTLKATVTDTSGNLTSVNHILSVINGAIVTDTIAPVVSISAPIAGASIGSKVQITAKATDNVGVTSMEVYIDGILQASSTSGSVSTSWNSRKAAKGSHTITVKAYDAKGNLGTSSVTINK